MSENFVEKKEKGGFFKTLIIALLCAGIVRSFLFEPFHIPSSSMKPNLLIGDYLFVAKYSYGYSRYSFPFGFNFFEGRILKKSPKRGDIAVFRLPENPSINYIKRIVGLPGDKIQMLNGRLFINGVEVKRDYQDEFIDEDEKEKIVFKRYIETLPEGIEFSVLDQRDNSTKDTTGVYEVPQGHYFMMGDNRDNSQDSRFLNQVGYIPEENLVGRATLIFFSDSKPVWQFWTWFSSIRFNRILTRF